MTTSSTSHRTAPIPQVVAIVRDAAKLPPTVPILPSSHLVDDLRIDSLDLIGVILQIQDHFDIVIDEDLVPSLCRIEDLAEFVARQLSPVQDERAKTNEPVGVGSLPMSGRVSC
jgi:acyl carrier protein